MPLMNREAEALRKQNLKIMEDKRLRFVEDLQAMDFMPERMLFCSSEEGNFVALSRWKDRIAVIVSPTFGKDDDFKIELHEKLSCVKEDVYQKGTGLNGAFGFGTKAARGFKLHISLRDGSMVSLHVVSGRTSFLECLKAKRNPLLSPKRRRGDANIVWDLMPIDPNNLPKIKEALDTYYLA